MCASCEARARSLRQLATQFRRAADELENTDYVDFMVRTASDLETLAVTASGLCGCASETFAKEAYEPFENLELCRLNQ